MRYKLSDLVLQKAEDNVGKDKINKVMKKIALIPTYTLEDVASDLKLQAFDAAEIIRLVRTDVANIPVSSLFEESLIVNPIKVQYNIKDLDDSDLDNESLVNDYIIKVKFIIDVIREKIVKDTIKLEKTVEYAVGFFMKKYFYFLAIMGSMFTKLMVCVSEITNIIFGYLSDEIFYISGDK